MAGKLQNADHKSLAELQALGADKEQLLSTDKIYSPKSEVVLEESLRKNNYGAVAEPTASDDISENYEVGSKWVFDEVMYICFSNSVGAAEWGTVGSGASFKVSLLGEDIVKGKACYISTGDANGDTGRVEGKLYKLDITNEFRREYCGIMPKDKLTDEKAVVITGGTVGGLTGLPKGLPIFASSTVVGGWQTEAPTTSDYGIQQLGLANDDGTEIIINGALSATLVIVQLGEPVTLFVADQIGYVAGFARETSPDGFINAKNKTIGKTTGDYVGSDYQDIYKHIWGLSGLTANVVAGKGFYLVAASKAAGWETDWDNNVEISVDLRDEFIRFLIIMVEEVTDIVSSVMPQTVVRERLLHIHL